MYTCSWQGNEVEVESIDKGELHLSAIFVLEEKMVANEERSADDVTNEDHDSDDNRAETTSFRL